MRLTAYFQKPDEALAAAAEIRVDATARVYDAGLLEDRMTFRLIGHGLLFGGGAGALVGVLAGLAMIPITRAEWAPVLAMAAVALSAFGALLGALGGSAMAEAKRSSGQGLVVVAQVDRGHLEQVEQVLARHGAELLAA